MKVEEQNIQAPSEEEDVVRITPENIRNLIARIVEAVHPEKIYMFGSRARGDIHNYSDLDLLVVIETDEPDKRKRGVEIAWMTRGRGFPMDVLVYTPDEFMKAANHEDYWFDPLVKDVLKEGVLLYPQTA